MGTEFFIAIVVSCRTSSLPSLNGPSVLQIGQDNSIYILDIKLG